MQCPSCGRKLYFRRHADGWVCKNWKCAHYWKYGKGTAFRPDKVGKPVNARAQKECLDEQVGFTIIERSGGSWVQASMREFLRLIRNLIEPIGYTFTGNRCFSCERRTKTKRFTVYGYIGSDQIDLFEWFYCRDCAPGHAVFLLKMLLGELPTK